MTKLTKHDIKLIHALVKERETLDAEIARLTKQRKALTNAAIAEKFEVSPPRIAQMMTGAA